MTEKLKKAIESPHTGEEKKAVFEQVNDEIKELSPEELVGVVGGGPGPLNPPNKKSR